MKHLISRRWLVRRINLYFCRIRNWGPHSLWLVAHGYLHDSYGLCYTDTLAGQKQWPSFFIGSTTCDPFALMCCPRAFCMTGMVCAISTDWLDRCFASFFHSYHNLWPHLLLCVVQGSSAWQLWFVLYWQTGWKRNVKISAFIRSTTGCSYVMLFFFKQSTNGLTDVMIFVFNGSNFAGQMELSLS